MVNQRTITAPLGSAERTRQLTEETNRLLAQGQRFLPGGELYQGGGQNASQGANLSNTGVPGGDSSTGSSVYDELLKTLQQYLDELRKRGQAINPNIEITPEKLAEFTKLAESEIDPYYKTQLGLARETFLRDVGYTTGTLQRFEQDLERKYGQQVRQVGESAAERGFALSGIRGREEQDLATDVQRQIEDRRRELGFTAGTSARTFAQQYGGQAIPNIPTLGEAPRVLAGQEQFQKGTRELPFYELSPDVYQGLVGQKQFEQDAAKRTRIAELEQAERQRQAVQQSRDLYRPSDSLYPTLPNPTLPSTPSSSNPSLRFRPIPNDDDIYYGLGRFNKRSLLDKSNLELE